MSRPRFDHIEPAWSSIDPSFLDTPTFDATAIAEARGVEIVFKDERQTPIRSFKGRGTDLLVQGYPEGSHLVCASAGNFGQGMAVAGQRHGSRVTVFAATNAVRCKIERMRDFGAEVRLAGRDFDEAKDFARRHADEIGAHFIEDGAHPEIAEGAATLALELTRDCGDFDALLVPLGNGALAAGTGCWMKTVQPGSKVIAVAAAKSPSMGFAVLGQSYSEAHCGGTIADGIDVRVPIPAAVEAVRSVVDDVIFIPEELIAKAVHLLEAASGDKVEPAGAVGFAGFLHEPSRWSGQRLAIPICGANRDEAPSQQPAGPEAVGGACQ